MGTRVKAKPREHTGAQERAVCGGWAQTESERRGRVGGGR